MSTSSHISKSAQFFGTTRAETFGRMVRAALLGGSLDPALDTLVGSAGQLTSTVSAASRRGREEMWGGGFVSLSAGPGAEAL